jgi:hypothetical protein
LKLINHNAPVVVRKRIIIEKQKDKVWEVLTDIYNWPEWQTDIWKVYITNVVNKDNSFVWLNGFSLIKSYIHTSDKPNLLGWSNESLGIYAIHNWKLFELNGKTEVIVEKSMDGFFAQYFTEFFQKKIAKTLENWLVFLKTECEK